MAEKPVVEIDVDVIKSNQLSLLISDGSKEAWIPRSLISDVEMDKVETKKQVITKITIPEWLAIEKELV